MAAASSGVDPREEASCSLCLDYFKDPVTLECGHSFCRSCLTQCWEKTGNSGASCPLCQGEVQQRDFSTNGQLANIVTAVKKLNPSDKGGKGGKQEAQKNDSEDDETTIPVVYDTSKEQHDHRTILLGKAVQDCKEDAETEKIWFLKDQKKHLLVQLEEMEHQIGRMTNNQELSSQENLILKMQDELLQEKAEMEKIFGEITRVRWFLEDTKKHLCAQMEEMEHQIERERNDHELSSLENLILKIQDELLQAAKSLPQRSEKKETFKKSVASPPELNWRIQEFCEQNPDQATIIKQFQGAVTLDPDSAPSSHFLSDGHKSGRYEAEPQDLPDNPGQFKNPTYMSGIKGLTTRCHAEEYAMQGIWPGEMATKPVRGKGRLLMGPKEWIWPMGKRTGIYPDTSLPNSSGLSLSEKTKGVHCYLNGAEGRVGFFDGEMGAQIDAISEVPFSAVSVLPFFYM